MKTTIELPDELFREAKATAALEGKPLKAFVAEALRDKLATRSGAGDAKPWMRHFGALSDLPADEHQGIEERIEAFCERIDKEKWS